MFRGKKKNRTSQTTVYSCKRSEDVYRGTGAEAKTFVRVSCPAFFVLCSFGVCDLACLSEICYSAVGILLERIFAEYETEVCAFRVLGGVSRVRMR